MHVTKLLPNIFIAVLALASVALALDGIVFECDFEDGPAPPEFSGAGSVVDTQGYDLYNLGDWFLHNATGGGSEPSVPPDDPGDPTVLTLADLPPHTHVTICMDLAIIDSWDGSQEYWGDDFFNVTVDGEVVFRETITNFVGEDPQTFEPAPEQVIVQGEGLFDMPPTEWDIDSLYAMGPSLEKIPHIGSDLVIALWANGDGWQGGVDESWAIDNIKVCLLHEVAVDIKPRSCPNPINVKSKGVLPVAVLGTDDFDVSEIDPATIGLSREGVVDEDDLPILVAPLRWAYEDVATPFEGELCDCHTEGPDGTIDLTLKFRSAELVEKLRLDEIVGETVPLTLTGRLRDDNPSGIVMPIYGRDCVRVR